MRLIVHFGTEGSEPTTVATATALTIADGGNRTLLASTVLTPPGNLLEMRCGAEPRQLAPHLWAQTFARPGQEEVVALLHTLRHARQHTYDVVVLSVTAAVDMAGLLATPHVVEGLGEDATSLRAMLTDPTTTTYRLVVPPHPYAYSGAQQMITSLNLYDGTVDAVVLWQLLASTPPSTDPRCAALQQQHTRAAAQAQQCFAPLPVVAAPYVPTADSSDNDNGNSSNEQHHIETLRQLGAAMWQHTTPLALHHRQTSALAIDSEAHRLRLPLLFAAEEAVQVEQHADMLSIAVGWWRRDIALDTTALAQQRATSMTLHQGTLEIRFEETKTGQ